MKIVSSILVVVFLLGGAMPAVASQPSAADYSKLKRLNEGYVEAFLKADVEWFRNVLADDFVCIESDGMVLNKTKFLEEIAKGADVPQYKLEQVQVRIYENVALVQATGSFIRKDGTTGKSRYTDVYVRSGNEWKVVSAQITRTRPAAAQP